MAHTKNDACRRDFQNDKKELTMACTVTTNEPNSPSKTTRRAVCFLQRWKITYIIIHLSSWHDQEWPGPVRLLLDRNNSQPLLFILPALSPQKIKDKQWINLLHTEATSFKNSSSHTCRLILSNARRTSQGFPRLKHSCFKKVVV